MGKNGLFIWLLMVGTMVSAQITFEAIPNKNRASVGERVQVSFIVTLSENKQMSQILYPSFSGFQMLGRNVGQNVNIANGKTTIQYVETVVLRPQKEGKIEIKSGKVTIDGKEYRTEPITFEITKAPEPKAIKNEMVFMELHLSKDEVYPNEALFATVKLYAKSFDLLRRRSDIEVPGLSNFQVKKISANQDRDFQQESINNQVYISENIAEFQLIPKETGELIIPSFNLRVAVPMDFFEEKIVPVRTPETKVVVNNFPKGAPKNFKGAVGDFTFNIYLSNKNAETNESIDYEVELIGEGNLSSIMLPKIKAPEELEIYPPKSRNAFQSTLNGEKGKLVDAYVIVPQYGGKYSIPSMEFSYFNPKEKAYKTIKTKEVKLNVKGKLKEKLKIDSTIIKQDSKEDEKSIIPEIPEDIANIFDDKQDELAEVEELTQEKKSAVNKTRFNWLYTLVLIPIVGLLLWFILGKKKKNKQEGLANKFSKKEFRNQLKIDLKALESLSKDNKREEFLDKSAILLNNVVIYAKQQDANYTISEARKILLDLKSENFANRWESLYNQTQMMKYGVFNSESELNNHYQQHEQIIKDLIN